MNKNKDKIYLDYASSASFEFPNPGALHESGVKEKNKLEGARRSVAQILHARPHEIIFTSGATESNNLAVMGIVNAARAKDFFGPSEKIPRPFKKFNFVPHVVTTNIEHASVLEVCRHLEKTKQAKVTYIGVEKNGIVDPKKIKQALRKETVLVSVMYANNEIGTIQLIREIGKVIRHFNKTHSKETGRKISFHTDATQAVNYLPVNVSLLGVDLISFNGAKIYGPKGVGVLYVKKNTPLAPLLFGGDQEFGLRPGTENVPAILALRDALEFVDKIKDKETKRLTHLRDYFIDSLIRANKRIVVNGDRKERLPNNVNITVPKIPSDLLVIELSERGIMTSSKSACKSGDGKASYVIKAINPTARDMDGAIRFSLGRETTKADIDYTVRALSQILTKLEKWYT